MKTKLNRKIFLETLDKVKPGLSNQAIVEQSSTFVFKGNRVYTFNDEISVEAPIEVNLPECAVPAEELYKLIERTQTEELELEFTNEELIIKANRMSAGIRIEKTITLPVEEIQQEEKVMSLPGGFFDGLRYCIPCVSKNQNNPVLTCVNISQTGLIESCDNFRLMRYKTDMEKKKKLDPFLLPASSAKQLLNYETLKKYGITPDRNWIRFSTEEKNDFIISCRTYQNMNYPDLDDIMKRVLKENQELIKFPKNMENIIERVSVFLSTDPLDEVIEVHLKEDLIEMEGKGQSGWCKEHCRIEYKSSPISFLINPRNFKEILKQMTEGTVGDNTIHFRSERLDHVIWINRVDKKNAKNY